MDISAGVSQLYDGNIIIRLLPFVIAAVAAYILSRTILFGLKHVARRLVKKTKTILDDLLLEAIDLPLTLVVGILSIYVAAVVVDIDELAILQFALVELAFVAGAIAVYNLFKAVLRWYVVEVASHEQHLISDMEVTIRRIAALFIIIITMMLMLDGAGVEISPLIASLGIAGLAVALAFQDTLSNFFAGIYVSIDRPIKEGDFLQLDSGHEGYVEKIGWRSTQIRLISNNIVVIPNSKLASSTLINYNAPDKEMTIVIPASVGYQSNLAKVEKVVLDVASKIQKNTKGAQPSYTPLVRFKNFGESGIDFSVILQVGEYVDKYFVTHEFIKALHARFAKEGIEIPFPKRSVYIESLPPGGFGGQGPKSKGK